MNEHRILNVTQSLVGIPGLLSGSEDFGLDSDPINRTKARYFDSEAAETLVENDRSRLAIIGKDDGVIGLVAKRDRKLYYYVRFTTSRIPMSDQAVTQIELWRHRRVEEFFPSITRHVFFSVLLNRFPAVMSDSLHTVQGQQFWERMVAAAKGMGLTIQMLDLADSHIVTYDPEQVPDIGDWLIQVEPWGYGTTFTKRRLIIRRP
ncbi:hypothetical protein [uncultured Methylobacterium sp.]|jgi:hypothetical protein|uniref:hypothetical protein n=1 Tax=uncultured Methylobacterium sp. TaxID=157278 RepID=UPI00261BD3FF|nr:hypothetical protein [uncultured Methylobacterium sp.]